MTPRIGPALILLTIVSCSAPPPEADPSAQVGSDLSTPGATTTALDAARTVQFPNDWATSAEVPFRPLEPTPEAQLIIDGDPSGEIDLSTPFELGEYVLFASGSAVISPQADAILLRVAVAAATQIGDGQRLRVEGHVDEVGTTAFNQQLADDRAAAVTARLLRNAPELEGRIDAVGFGEDLLLHPTCHGDCPANRVVVLSIA